MKEAMWGLGLIMLCLLAFVIIGVISNITLTNQQDYYGVKQTSEGSAYDSIDVVSYKKGICVCANNVAPNEQGVYVIKSKYGYTITEPDDNNECESKTYCELRLGEYVIDPKLFNENIIVRLGSIIKQTEVYDIKVQEIIPYPPKISVYISYHQALNVEGEDRINQEIPNKFDAIFEDTGTQSVLTYKQNTLDAWPLTCTESDEEKKYCYYDADGKGASNKYQWCPTFNGEDCVKNGYEAKIAAKEENDCKSACMCINTNGVYTECAVWPDVSWPDTAWGGKWTTSVPEGSCAKEACYRKYTNKQNDEYELQWASKSPGSGWEKTDIAKTNCRMACFVKEENGKKKYSWNGWGQWTGWVEDSTKTKDTCKEQSSYSGGGNCNWYYYYGTPHQCKDGNGGTIMKYSSGSSGFNYAVSQKDKAMNDCKIAACGSVDKYASGCQVLMGYDYKIESTSNKLHRNESSSNWCSGKGYYYCSCVNRKS